MNTAISVDMKKSLTSMCCRGFKFLKISKSSTSRHNLRESRNDDKQDIDVISAKRVAMHFFGFGKVERAMIHKWRKLGDSNEPSQQWLAYPNYS